MQNTYPGLIASKIQATLYQKDLRIESQRGKERNDKWEK